MVNSSDRERIQESGDELSWLVYANADENENIIVLVFANKQDIENGNAFYLSFNLHTFESLRLESDSMLSHTIEKQLLNSILFRKL